MTTTLPFSKKMAYAVGQLGWSTLINIVNLQLVYFYIPPAEAGIPVFITQAVFLVVLNTLTLIAASGRLLDAITDPIIAGWSDRWKGPKGRRIPFLRAGALPAAAFCFLMFVPLVQGDSGWNIAWLILVQALFYLALTVYVTPYFALLAELGHNARERLDLSTWISITYALGIILASQLPVLADLAGNWLHLDSKVSSIQWAVGLLAALAAAMMWIPGFTIDEKKYVIPGHTEIPILEAVKRPFKNPGFRYYVVADFSYFLGLTIVMTGLLYYITVLLQLPESMMGILLPILILVSFIFYPLVNFLAKRIGKKPLITGAFLWMSLVFLCIFFLGKMMVNAQVQAYTLVILLAVPISFLGILPNAVLADIAEHDGLKSGIKQEGMYFAARTLMQKFGQTLGVIIFAMLTIFGKDVGDDWGIRVSGLVGAIMCLMAGIYFLKYEEKRLLQEVAILEEQITKGK